MMAFRGGNGGRCFSSSSDDATTTATFDLTGAFEVRKLDCMNVLFFILEGLPGKSSFQSVDSTTSNSHLFV